MPPISDEEQTKLVKQFKDECISEGVLKPESEAANDDFLLLRFLRARQFNLRNAKLMLKNSEEWRASVGGLGMEDLYKKIDPFEYPERDVVFQHWPLYFHKADKKGRPVNIHNFGRINVSELNKAVSPERFDEIFTVNCELLTREILPACSQAAGRHIGTVFVIIDLKGFGVSQFWSIKDRIRHSFQVSQDYYPETMGQVAIINAPMTFTTMWSAIKPWLAKETVDKIDILGSDYRVALLRLVDADSLPAEYGGECTCADAGGDCAKSSVGPWMRGREERRAAWVRGERAGIAIDGSDAPPNAEPQDLEKKDAEKNDKAVPPNETGIPTTDIAAAPNGAAVPLAAQQHDDKVPLPRTISSRDAAPDVPLEAAKDLALPQSMATSAATSKDAIDSAETYATYPELAEPDVQQNISAVPGAEALPPAQEGKEPTAASNDFVLPKSSSAASAANGVHTSAEPSSNVSMRSITSGEGAPAPSQKSTVSRRSTKSRKSTLGSIFSAKNRQREASSIDREDEDIDDAPTTNPRKSHFKATVERIVDKIHQG